MPHCGKAMPEKEKPGTRPGFTGVWERGHTPVTRTNDRRLLPAEARAHEPLAVAGLGQLHFATQAPVLVELGGGADAAVELAVRVDAVLLAVILVTASA